jgi:hypothetical protein
VTEQGKPLAAVTGEKSQITVKYGLVNTFKAISYETPYYTEPEVNTMRRGTPLQ